MRNKTFSEVQNLRKVCKNDLIVSSVKGQFSSLKRIYLLGEGCLLPSRDRLGDLAVGSWTFPRLEGT